MSNSKLLSTHNKSLPENLDAEVDFFVLQIRLGCSLSKNIGGQGFRPSGTTPKSPVFGNLDRDRLCDRAVRQSIRDQEERGSIPGRVIPRTLKVVLAADPPSVWHYGFRAKCCLPGVRIMCASNGYQCKNKLIGSDGIVLYTDSIVIPPSLHDMAGKVGLHGQRTLKLSRA
ncbi:hypothetical protein ElyMa_001322400 [Elysia marginata]|uniref:Uncharacterized protein n=1 Tax=Elysia marginata TaxID=1093978 RepID=A0AAV4IIV5_9GAST|nr:hypothetical protein ElyMa_001322400 [Elysia marginata]